jgi:phosphatidylglycerol:prolipoprotein diacylglycerol transferase
MSIAFPDIDPIILQLGPLAISWYSLSYAVGIIIGSYYCKWLISRFDLAIKKQDFDDFISYLIVGIIVGGRLGYVLVYNPGKYFANPIEILKTYEGGMSFHGGIIGVIFSAIIFCHYRRIAFFQLADLLAAAAPIGIALGRIANFINCELVGRISNMPFAVEFPPDFIARHPSQIYESLTEGVMNFIIIYFLIMRFDILKRQKMTSAVFLLIYGFARIFCENFREPDYQIGFIFDYLTMGQILSMPFIFMGFVLLWRASKKY